MKKKNHAKAHLLSSTSAVRLQVRGLERKWRLAAGAHYPAEGPLGDCSLLPVEPRFIRSEGGLIGA